MVQHGVAEHEVEAPVLERQPLGVGAHGLDLEPSRCALALSVASIPGEMSVQVACSISPARSRFSVKYPGPRADLQRARVVAGCPPSALRTLAATCSRPTSPKSMPHFAS